MKNRADILVDIGTLSTNSGTSFPDNNSKYITALILRTWIDELILNISEIVDSYFNKLDELRLTSTTAYDIVATPSNWNGNIAPITQNLVNDELASRVKTIETSLINNHSLSVFYVSKQGDDGTAQEGNELRPYATINAAITAMGANPTNKKLVVLGGGTYPDTGSITITITNATNCVFDFGSANIVGNFTGTNINNSYVNFKGGKLTGNFTTTGTNTLYDFTGGEITGAFTVNSVFNSTFLLSKIGSNVSAINSSYSYFDFNNATINGYFTFYNTYTCVIKNAYVNVVTQCWLETYICDNINILSSTVSLQCSSNFFYNCNFTASLSSAFITSNSNSNIKKFINCKINNNGSGYAVASIQNDVFINCEINSNTGKTIMSSMANINDIKKITQLYNCKVKSNSNINIGGDSGEVGNVIAYNTKFYTIGNSNIKCSGDALVYSKFLQFKNCEFYTTGTANNFVLTNNLIRPAEVNYQFIGCSFYTETGYAFLEPTYDVSDAGKVIAVNCLANQLTLTSVAPVKITEQNNYFDVNLQNFNNI